MKTLVSQNSLVFNPPELGCVLFLPGLPWSSSKIHDRSPYGNHGTITGATWKRLPSGLWCLSFDGIDDKVTIADSASLNFTTGDFTIECWMYTPTLHDGALFMKGISATSGYRLMIRADGRGYFTTSSPVERSTTAAGAIVANVWQHILLTRVGAVATIYKNGVDVTTSNGTHIDPADATGTYGLIGIDSWGTLDYLGSIALSRVYTRALSALEIQNHFNREKHLFGV